MNKKNGFTLAEVLITLSILGVVAAISIPNIVNNFQKRLIIAKAQKAYASLEVAAQNIAINTGCIGRDIACTGLLNYPSSWAQPSGGNNEVRELNDKFMQLAGFRVISFYNGHWIRSYFYGKDCSDYIVYARKASNGFAYKVFLSNDVSTKSWEETTTAIIVSVITEPNKIYNSSKNIIQGKNKFDFVIYDNFIVEPVVRGKFSRIFVLSALNKSSNFSDSHLISGCDSNDSSVTFPGYNCTARLIHDGWKINY